MTVKQKISFDELVENARQQIKKGESQEYNTAWKTKMISRLMKK